MAIPYPGTTAYEKLTVEYCYLNIMFCREQGFTLDQTAAFHAITRSVFEASVVRGETSMEKTFEAFTSELLDLSVQEFCNDQPLFSIHNVARITEFVTRGLYRHYLLYSLCFRQEVAVRNESRFLEVETPLTPPPLGELVKGE
ncbi:unnamed protein product [Discosporangium mesarthrocarpum]